MNSPKKTNTLHYNPKSVSFAELGGFSPDLKSSPVVHTSHAFSTADKSFTTNSSIDIRSPTRTITEFNKEPLKLKVLEVTPRAGLNVQEQLDIEEFEDSPISAHLTKRHLSDKTHSPGVHKKSMSDIAARIERNKTMNNFASTLLTQPNEGKGDDDTNSLNMSGSFSRALWNENFNSVFQKPQHKRANTVQLSLDLKSLQERKTFPKFGRVTYQVERKKINIEDMVILENVLKFLDFQDTWKMSKICYNFRNLKIYKKLFTKTLNSHFTQGLNSHDQIAYWNHLLNFRKLKNERPFAFSQHFVKRCLYIEQIKKDLDRTLPEYQKFSTEEGRASLLRVLIAISNTIQDMGYIQGLNSIAGTFLLYLKEEEAFWIMMYFMEKLKFKDLLNESFSKINELNYQLKVYLQYYLPQVTSSLQEKGFDVSYFSTSWFLTLFSHHMTVPNVLRVWNLLFTRGKSFLIQMAIAIFDKYKDSILRLDSDEIGPFIKLGLAELSDYETELYDTALSYRVSKKLDKEFEFYYTQGQPKIELTINSRMKLQILPDKNFKSRRNSLSKTEKPKDDGMNLRKHHSTKERINTFFQSVSSELSASLQNIFSKGPSRRNSPIKAVNLDELQREKANLSNIEDDAEEGVYTHQSILNVEDALPQSNYPKTMPRIQSMKWASKTIIDDKPYGRERREEIFNKEQQGDLFSSFINQSQNRPAHRRSNNASVSIFGFPSNVSSPSKQGYGYNQSPDSSPAMKKRADAQSAKLVSKGLSSIFDTKRIGSFVDYK